MTSEEAAAFTLGESLIDARGKEGAGEILKITVCDALREDSYGCYPLPERKMLLLTLGGEGVMTKEGAKIGTLTPRVGDTLDLFGRAKLSGLCLRVRAI